MKCNEFGHVADKCPQTEKTSAMCVFDESVSDIKVIVNGRSVSAIFDSGSDVSIIREDIFDLIGKPKLVCAQRILTGVGGNEVTSLGYFS